MDETVHRTLVDMERTLQRIADAQEERLRVGVLATRSKFFAKLPAAVQDAVVKISEGEPVGPIAISDRTLAENIKNAGRVYGHDVDVYWDEELDAFFVSEFGADE